MVNYKTKLRLILTSIWQNSAMLSAQNSWIGWLYFCSTTYTSSIQQIYIANDPCRQLPHSQASTTLLLVSIQATRGGVEPGNEKQTAAW